MPSASEPPIRDFRRRSSPRSARLRLTTGAAIYAMAVVHLIAVTHRVLF